MTSTDELLKRYCGRMTVAMKNGDELELKMPSPRDMAGLIQSIGEMDEERVDGEQMSNFLSGVNEVAINILKKTYPDASDEVIEDIVANNFTEFNTAITDIFGNMQNAKPTGGRRKIKAGKPPSPKAKK